MAGAATSALTGFKSASGWLIDLGRSDTITLEQARRKARLYIGTAADGKDPKSNIDEMRASMTVKKLAEPYIERHAKPKKRTWKADESALNQLFIPRFGTHLAFKPRANKVSSDLALVNTPTQGPPRFRRISRQDLFNLIWSEPMTTLAKRFGISDRGLTKVCQRSDIPAPPRGYLAKISAGGTFERPDLPNRDDLSSRKVGFRINLSASRQQPLQRG